MATACLSVTRISCGRRGHDGWFQGPRCRDDCGARSRDGVGLLRPPVVVLLFGPALWRLSRARPTLGVIMNGWKHPCDCVVPDREECERRGYPSGCWYGEKWDRAMREADCTYPRCKCFFAWPAHVVDHPPCPMTGQDISDRYERLGRDMTLCPCEHCYGQ